MTTLENKIALITGGGSGIGRSISEVFARAGAQVHILDYNLEQAETVQADILSADGKCDVHQCDVSKSEEVNRIITKIYKREGRIDILVNNAGISHIGSIETTNEADFQRVFEVNVKGVFHCAKAVLPHMVDNGGGVLLNMASVAATVALQDRFAYSMSKAAVLNMTITIAKDYIDRNIRCNSISPGRVHTPFVDAYLKKNYPGKESEMFEKLSKTQPIGRMGKPGEIAQLALFLCADNGAGFITGTDYPIDGGFIKLNT